MTAARPVRWYRLVNGTLMARQTVYGSLGAGPGRRSMALTWAFALERVTGIEPALSAWEADVLPLNYTRAHEYGLVTLSAGRACTVSAQTWYRNR